MSGFLARITRATLLLAVAASAAIAQSATVDTDSATVDTLAEIENGTGGLSIDAEGNVYSSDFGHYLGGQQPGGGAEIIKITPAGEVSVFADGLQGASGSGIDSAGNFYQSNIRGSFITKIARDGTATRFASEGFQSPVGIEIDPDDVLYVANCGSNSIQRVRPDGTSERFVESPLLACPNGITRGDDGTFYVANFYNGDVIAITADGEASKLATLPGNNNGHLVFHDGALWVVARSAHQIYRVSLDGEMELVAGSGEKGGKDGPALEASFCYPNDVGFSPDGSILYVNEVADQESQGLKLVPTRVRRIVWSDPMEEEGGSQ